MKHIEIKNAWQGNSDCRSCSIRSSALFAELNEEDFSKIHQQVNDLRQAVDSQIYLQGDAADHLYTLREGFIKLIHINPDGSERIIRLVTRGDLFGTEGLLGSVYNNTAIALTNVYFCRIPKSVISMLMQESPRLHGQMLKKLGEALTHSESWFSEINTGRVELRLARLLLRLCRDFGGNVTIPLFKREDMGLMIDAKFETVSRALSSLAESGLLADVTRFNVKVNDVTALRQYCALGVQ